MLYRTKPRRHLLQTKVDLLNSHVDCYFFSFQLDTSCDGFVDWNEFTTYMLLQFRENDYMRAKKQIPFPNEAKIRHIVHNRVGTWWRQWFNTLNICIAEYSLNLGKMNDCGPLGAEVNGCFVWIISLVCKVNPQVMWTKQVSSKQSNLSNKQLGQIDKYNFKYDIFPSP